MPLSRYRQSRCVRATHAGRRASVRHRSDSGPRAASGACVAGPGPHWGGLHDQQADGREWDSTAGMEKAEVADFHKAIRQDVLEEPAEKLHDVEVGSA